MMDDAARFILDHAKAGNDIAILHDADLDGYVASAIVASIATSDNKATVKTLAVPHGASSTLTLKQQLSKRCQKDQLTIVLDLALTIEVYETIVKHNTNVVWIDHHPVMGKLEELSAFDARRAMFLIDETSGLSTTGLANSIYLRFILSEISEVSTNETLVDEINRYASGERAAMRSSFIDLVNHFDTGLAMSDPGARISIMARALNSAFWSDRSVLLETMHTLFGLSADELSPDDVVLDWVKKTYEPYNTRLEVVKASADELYALIHKYIDTIVRVREEYENSISKNVIKLKIKPVDIDDSYSPDLKPEISIAMVMHSSHVEEIAIAILEEHPDVDAAAVTYVKGRDGQVIRKTSLRGRNTPGVDLNVLAKTLGNGGGHANAAGYETVIVAPMVDIGKLAT